MKADEKCRARAVSVNDRKLVVELEDGRTIHVPLAWFPKLRKAQAEQLADYRLIGRGAGIHWPQLDEDLSVRGLLMPEAQRGPRLRKTG